MPFYSALVVLGLLQAAPSVQVGSPSKPTASSASTQNTQSTNISTPTDPKELLETGRRVNGLGGAEIRPWHLRANYEVFEEDGTTRDKGIFEEWWVNKKMAKVSYATKQLAYTMYTTDQGRFRVGDTSQRTGAEPTVQNMLTTSTLDFLPDDQSTLKVKDGKIGSLTLRCLTDDDMQPQFKSKAFQQKGMFCFDTAKPILRFTLEGNSVIAKQTIRDKIIAFQNRYIAREVVITRNGKKYLSINLESIELLDQVEEASMKPPSDATRYSIDTMLRSSDKSVIPPSVLHSVDPLYPPKASMDKAEGVVTIEGVVGTDGRISDLVAIDGPPAFRQSALKAVGQYTFKAATQGGKPVPVLVNIVVNFQIY